MGNPKTTTKHAREYYYKERGHDIRVIEPIKAMKGLDFIFGKGISLSVDSPNPQFFGKKQSVAIEVHNMFGNVFKSYGAIGFFFFSLWILKILKKSRKLKMVYGL